MSAPFFALQSAAARRTFKAPMVRITARRSGTPSSFLVVDNDPSSRTRLVDALGARGLEARGAGAVAEALELAASVCPQGAIIDLPMPAARSLELLPELTARRPGIRMVVLSYYGNIATAVEAVRRGAIDYLSKPVGIDRILAAFDEDGSADPWDDDPDAMPTLKRVEWEHINRVLNDCDGNISLTARRLGLHRRSLQRKLAKLPPIL